MASLDQDRARSELPAAPQFSGTDRFEVRKRLGSGSFGVVYEAYDHVRSATVALKWLRYAEPETIFRFKNEFRSLADISHPNLVQLFDLESHEEHWFFTMEVVRGDPVPEFLRPDVLAYGPATLTAGVSTITRKRLEESTPEETLERASRDLRAIDVDANEVRGVFRELAIGVSALHAAGKLHRDLKCQNVLVTPDQRTVLLDFGMVREVTRSGKTSSDGLDIAGTPLYMAPEQCAGAPVSRPADWYAFGVMLFRALTDEFPFVGRTYEVMTAKQTRDAERPSELVDGIPEDLDDLCAELLRRDPLKRPDGPKVLEVLGAVETARVSYPTIDADVFVGRRRELRVLEAARRRVGAGFPTVVYVHGPSGIGKTALVRHFLARVEDDAADPLVLRGRCYERETLPFKALDSVVDDLVSQLRSWSPAACAEIVPEGAADLVRVFPSLMRVPAFVPAVQLMSEAPDPQEQRRRAVAAFEELLHALSKQRNVVIFMDDLQWGDGDSAQFVRPLLHGPEDPLVLWIGTYRTDEAAGSGYLDAMHGTSDTDEATLFVEVPELPEEEARTLLELGLAGTSRDEDLLDELSREAAGSPLLIDLLVRHAHDRGRDERADLGAVLDDLMQRLPDDLRSLLAFLAVRGRPLARSLAAEVVGVDSFDVTSLTKLRNSKLLRLRDRGDEEELELYHDRIRETVTASLSEEREREIHAALAAALAKRDDAEPEALARHHEGAEQWSEAFRFTVEAAHRAAATLAFARAAALYQEALRLYPIVGDVGLAPDPTSLVIARADALRNAGRGAEAAKAYLLAAEKASPQEALELRRLGAEQYLFGGHLDEGRAVLKTVLREVGLSMPEHPLRTLAEFLARRGQVRFRGLKFTERSPDDIPVDVLVRIDVCWSVSIGFSMVDPVRGGVFQARHLLMALDAGDLSRVARAVAVEVAFSATAGVKNDARTAQLRLIGKELAHRAGSPYIHGLLGSSSGGAEWLVGRWANSLELQEESTEILRRQCTGVAWEISTATIVLLDSLWRMGRFPELLERWPDVLDDALARGDRLLEIYVRIKFDALAHLAAGRPDDALREANTALSRWSQPGFQLLHYWELFSRIEAQIYAGRMDVAWDAVTSGRPTVARSGLLQLQMYDVTWRDIEGRVALGRAAGTHGRERRSLLKEAAAAAKRIDKSGAPWGVGLAATLRAGLASVEGDRSETRRWLERAERAFVNTDMALHAEVVRCRKAQLDGDESAVAESLSTMRGLWLEEPERWLVLLAPGTYPE